MASGNRQRAEAWRTKGFLDQLRTKEEENKLWPPAWDDEKAATLLALFKRAQGKKGRGAGRESRMVKNMALEELRINGAPPSFIELFDVMLGGVAAKVSQRDLWLQQAAVYEARVHHECTGLSLHEVTNADLTDEVVMPNNPEWSDRDHVMRKVRKARKGALYPAFYIAEIIRLCLKDA